MKASSARWTAPAAANPDWNAAAPDPATSNAPWRLFNVGNSYPVKLIDYIEALETALGMKAVRNLLPLQPGDVPDALSDKTALNRATGYAPGTSVSVGVQNFVDWYLSHYALVKGELFPLSVPQELFPGIENHRQCMLAQVARTPYSHVLHEQRDHCLFFLWYFIPGRRYGADGIIRSMARPAPQGPATAGGKRGWVQDLLGDLEAVNMGHLLSDQLRHRLKAMDISVITVSKSRPKNRELAVVDRSTAVPLE